MNTNITDLAWRIGGPQGSGVDSAAGMFLRACAMGGHQLFGRREYYSNIMGRHSYYDVRVSNVQKTCHRDVADLLCTFEPESLARHAVSVVEGGAIIHAAKDANVKMKRLTYFDERPQADLVANLEAQGLPTTTAGVLESARRRGVSTYAVPFRDLIAQLSESLGIPHSNAQRAMNTFAVAASGALLEYPRELIHEAIARTWPGRQKIIDMNVAAVDVTYDYVIEHFDTSAFKFRLKPLPEEEHEPCLLLNGTQSCALGKLAGGLTFQSYYPISPATAESFYLEAHETFALDDGGQGSVVVIQTEDEISAVTMAAGAALTGSRCSTATSGPGFALMAEALGWTGHNEVPLVVTLWQRGGPSTGMPTRTEQGDLAFALNAGHGDFPRIVMATSDVSEAFYDAAQAFNYADRYQTVVVHLLDKQLASTSQTVPEPDPTRVTVERGSIFTPTGDEEGTYARFTPTDTGVSPRAFLGTPGGAHWFTGVEHSPIGRVTEDPVVREHQMEKRMRKLETAAREIPTDEKLSVYGDPEAELTVLAWGSTKGCILETLELLADKGINARALHIRLLWPFPAEELQPYLDSASPLVSVELNFTGQLTNLVRAQTGKSVDHFITKYNGRPISARHLHATLETILAGQAESRIVLRNPDE